MMIKSICGEKVQLMIGLVVLANIFLSSLYSVELKKEIKDIIATKKSPIIACTVVEKNRLRGVWGKKKGEEFKALFKIIARAKTHLKKKISYPKRGGQHNQWYQCGKCELPLKTITSIKHQCSKCKKVYTGYPYDDVVFAKTHRKNFVVMHDCAWAWLITGKKEFANFSKEILLQYSSRYKKYPFHGNSMKNNGWVKKSGGHLFEQTLDEACAMAKQIAPAYDLIKGAGVLTEKEDKKIINELILPILRNINKYKAGKNNWQTWHNAAMLWGGIVTRQPIWVERALYEKHHGFYKQMSASITEDGMWYEGSWAYHFYAQNALILIAEGARPIGIDLWSHPKMKKTFTHPLNWTMPSNLLPRFGDSVNLSLRKVCSKLWEPAYHSYKNNNFLPLLSDTPNLKSMRYGRKTSKTGLKSQLKNCIFKNSGHAILRSNGKSGLTVAVTFGPHGGFHGHYDKLGFVMYGFGKELAVDPGRAASQAYRLPIHSQWYRASISHNVVVVDGKSQAACKGNLLLYKNQVEFGNEKKASVLLLENIDSYAGVNHKRLFLLTDKHLILIDILNSDKKHQYDWFYHNHGSSINSNIKLVSTKPLPSYAGMTYLKNIKKLKSNKQVEFHITGDGISTCVLTAPVNGSEYMIADGPGESVIKRVPLVMVRRRGHSATFATVFETVITNEDRSVDSIKIIGKGQYEIKIKNKSTILKITEKALVIDSVEINYR